MPGAAPGFASTFANVNQSPCHSAAPGRAAAQKTDAAAQHLTPSVEKVHPPVEKVQHPPVEKVQPSVEKVQRSRAVFSAAMNARRNWRGYSFCTPILARGSGSYERGIVALLASV